MWNDRTGRLPRCFAFYGLGNLFSTRLDRQRADRQVKDEGNTVSEIDRRLSGPGDGLTILGKSAEGAEMETVRDSNREAALAEAKALLDAGDSDQIILTATKRILETLQEINGPLCDAIAPGLISASLVIRCIARKAEEALASIVAIVELGHSYPATALLRQMCEELIFAKFLRTLPRADADEYVRLRARLEIHEGIKAQDSFFTSQQEKYNWPDESDPRTLPKLPPDAEALAHALKNKLKAIGDRNGWGKKPKPTAKEMATQGGLDEVYGFFYHAASSSVHASLHHLLRMVWVDSSAGHGDISSRHLEQHYRRVALIYGAWIANQVIEVITDEFPGAFPENKEDSFGIWMAIVVAPAVVHRSPPIVTSRELE